MAVTYLRRHFCLCGNSLRTVYWAGTAALRFCDSCRLGMSDPFPSEETGGELYHIGANDTNFEAIGDSIIDRLKDYFGRRDLRKMTSEPVRHVLDFGTGNGRFAILAASVFPDCVVTAADYQAESPVFPQALAERITYRSIATIANESTLYDLILLRHVLEHNQVPSNSYAGLLDDSRRVASSTLKFQISILGSRVASGIASIRLAYPVTSFTSRGSHSPVPSRRRDCADP